MGTSATLQSTAKDIADFRKNLGLYTSKVLRVVTKQGVLQPLDANFAQAHVQGKLAQQLKDTGRIRAIVLKARQEGVSTWVAARFYRRCTLYSNQAASIIADDKKRGAALFNIYDTYYRWSPDQFRPKRRYRTKGQVLWFDTIAGPGGLNSKIQVLTANDAAAGRATTIQMLHASEVAFWEHPEEVWVGLIQAVPDQGSEVIIESTANGVGNFFHQMWVDAEKGINGYVAIFLPWWVHEEYQMPYLSQDDREHIIATRSAWEREVMEEGIEWEGEMHKLSVERIAWRRRKIAEDFRGDERKFRQEFPSTPKEAFLVSGNCFFEDDVLNLYERHVQAPVFRGNLIRLADTIIPVKGERGYLKVWDMPRPKGHYVIFADTATGRQSTGQRETFDDPDSERGGRDFSAGYVFDMARRRYVAVLHGRMGPDIFAEALNTLGRFYSNRTLDGPRRPCLIGVERNHSSGESTLKMLREQYRYPALYHRRLINRVTQRATYELGWLTTEENRMPLLDEFAQALRENSISVPDADLIRECATFVRGDSGKPEAQEGCHDDRVIGASGCLQMIRHTRIPPEESSPILSLKSPQTPTGWAEY